MGHFIKPIEAIREVTASIRHGKIKSYVSGNVLDLGCNKCQLYYAIRENITDYTGIDIKNLNGGQPQNTQFINADLEHCYKLNILQATTFDTIVMAAILEHIANAKQVLRWCHYLLKPKGKIILTTPTKLGDRIVKPIMAKEYTHVHIYNRRELEYLLRSTGLNLIHYSKFELGCNQFIIAERS